MEGERVRMFSLWVQTTFTNFLVHKNVFYPYDILLDPLVNTRLNVLVTTSDLNFVLS